MHSLDENLRVVVMRDFLEKVHNLLANDISFHVQRSKQQQRAIREISQGLKW